MTLATNRTDELAHVDPAPTGDLGSLGAWCYRTLDRFAQMLRRPRVLAVEMAALQPGDPEIAKVEDGTVAYGVAGALGATEGLYLRTAGVWKKVTVV